MTIHQRLFLYHSKLTGIKWKTEETRSVPALSLQRPKFQCYSGLLLRLWARNARIFQHLQCKWKLAQILSCEHNFLWNRAVGSPMFAKGETPRTEPRLRSGSASVWAAKQLGVGPPCLDTETWYWCENPGASSLGNEEEIKSIIVLTWGGQLWNQGEIQLLVTVIKRTQILHVPDKGATEKLQQKTFVSQLALDPREAGLQTPSPLQDKSAAFPSYAMPSEMHSHDLQRIATLSETVCCFGLKAAFPRKVHFSGAGSTKLAANVSAQLRGASRAPAGRDAGQLRDNAPPAVLTGCCAWRRIAGARGAVLLCAAAFCPGQGSLTCTGRNHLLEMYSSVVLEMPRASYSVSAEGERKRSGVVLAAPFQWWLTADSYLHRYFDLTVTF